MKAKDLHHLSAGFSHESFGSQAVFRTVLRALSYPGRPLEMPKECALPLQGHGAAAALLLGLLDSDTSLWMSAALVQSDAAPWLRFHTGCHMVEDKKIAQFLWIANGDTIPKFSQLLIGSDVSPDHSATCIIEIQEFDTATGAWTLQGPGILGQCTLNVLGLPSDFQSQWALNHAAFPKGVDVILASPTHIVGLPRTTHILQKEKV